ncbi:MAG TPA: hypothetical protein EYG51_03880 [Pseudomonadales bacterium]|nr:hypothetical protein [Pseudomonadales bacterium]
MISKNMAAQITSVAKAVVSAPKSPFGTADGRSTTVPIALMNFIIYSKTNQALSVCECPLIRALCQTCWAQAKLPTRTTLRKLCKYEYLVFKAILRIELNLAKIYYAGMPFGQIMHDGGTLKNKQKYQTMGFKFIRPFNLAKICKILLPALKGKTKLSVEEMFALPGVTEDIYRQRTFGSSLDFVPQNISILFHPQGHSGTAEPVAKLMTRMFKKVTNLDILSVARNSISDAAALSVATFLGKSEAEEDSAEDNSVEEDNLHSPPSEESQEPKRISARLCDMHNLSKVIRWAIGTLEKTKGKRPYLPFGQGKNIVQRANACAKYFNYGMRRQQLHKVSLALNCPLQHPHVNVNGTRVMAEVRVLTHVIQKETAIRAIASSDSNCKDISVSTDNFVHMAELEALGFALGKYIYAAQTEKSYTGGYRLVMYIAIRKLLNHHGPGIPMFDRPVTKDPPPQRVPTKFSDLSTFGQEAWTRAENELDVRMRKSNISLDEVISMLGDIRLAKDQNMYVAEGKRLNLLDSNDLVDHVTKQWLKFYHASGSFLYGETTSIEAGSESREADVATAEPISIFGELPQQRDTVNIVYPRTPVDVLQRNLQEMVVASSKKYKDLTPMDLLDVDIGPHYSALVDEASFSDKEDVATFVAFLMARVGDNMAESYNERQIHVCNQIMTSDRTSMNDDILEWLAVLRMNRVWILERKSIFQDVLPHLDIGEIDGLSVV